MSANKDGFIAGHLQLGKSRTFSQTIFYFELIDTQSCIITGKEVNPADRDVMLVPYTLNMNGKEI